MKKLTKQQLSLTQKFVQIAELMAGFDHIPTHKAVELLALLDKAPASALEIMVAGRVKFCAAPARRRLQEKFKYSDAKIAQLIAYGNKHPYLNQAELPSEKA